MNTKEAKAEPLPEFLGRLGHEPASIRGSDVWFRSPFRPDERTPSFKVDRTKNIWYDHGMGVGGTIIDLMMQLEGEGDVSRVLERIASILGSAPKPTFVMPVMRAAAKNPPIIERVGRIEDRALEAYIHSRGIPIDLARLYLDEVAYQVGDHRFRALGLENDAGGFELRSPSFKGTIGKKDIRTLALAGSQKAAVFEGVFDFLSVLSHYKKDRAEANVVVLNSMAMMERGMERLQAANVNKLYAYLDNDHAGKAGLATLQSVPHWQVVDGSGLYAGFKDANEFWA